MKWLMVTAAALGLVFGTPALASPAAGAVQLAQNKDHQNRDRDRDHNRGTGSNTNRDSKQGMDRKSSTPAPKPAPMLKPGPRTTTTTHTTTRRTTTTRMMDRRHEVQQQRYDWSKYRPGQVAPVLKNRPRFDIHSWQRNFRAERHYHWKPYNRPRGWYYRRWVFGMVLPTLFWSRDYWIIDYWEFGLPNPPYGYVWVRYGDDAVLVSVHTGYILQVVYGLFD